MFMALDWTFEFAWELALVPIVEERNSFITAMVFSFSGLKVGNGSSSGNRLELLVYDGIVDRRAAYSW